MNRVLFEKVLLVIVITSLLYYFYHAMMNMVIQNLNLSLVSNVAGTRISTFLLFIIIAFSYLIHNKYNVYSNALIPLLFLWTIMVLVTDFVTYGNLDFQLFRLLINTLLPFLFCFYFYSVSYKYNIDKWFGNLMIFTLIFLLYVYYKSFNIANFLLESDQLQPITIAYFSLIALPVVFAFSNKKIRLISLIAVSVAIFLSMKRGGVVALVFSFFTYLTIQHLFISTKKSVTKGLIYVFLSLFLVIYGLSILDQQIGNMVTARIENIGDDQGSGRLNIYTLVLQKFADSNAFNMVFGHGYMAVLNSPIQFSAHNDFLEVMYNYGLLNLIVYLAIHLSLISFSIKLIRAKSNLAAPFAMSYVQFFIFSMISHVIYYAFFIIFAMFWGYVIGRYKRETELKTTLITSVTGSKIK